MTLGLVVAACSSTEPRGRPAPAPAAEASPGAGDEGSSPAGGAADSGGAAPAPGDPGDRLVAVGSPSIGPGGNRVAPGRATLGRTEPVDVALPGIPILVLPARSGWLDATGRPIEGPDPAPRWLVELDSGRWVGIDETFAVIDSVRPRPGPTIDGFDEPLPDAVVVETAGVAVSLVEPTDRYPHGALGDPLEAAAVEVIGPDPDQSRTFGPEPPAVIEGISVIVADATGDGVPEVLVTESDADQGASLALWSLDGERVARSVGIGLGNRWRNQLAIAPIGPGGETEVIDVRTPHIGGTVQFFEVEGSELIRVAAQTGYTSHRFGSRNLDLGAVFDADGDGRLDVVVPTDAGDAIGVLTRVPIDAGSAGDGVEEVVQLALPGTMTTNLAVGPAEPERDGPLAVAVGTDDAVLRIWPAPDRP